MFINVSLWCYHVKLSSVKRLYRQPTSFFLDILIWIFTVVTDILGLPSTDSVHLFVGRCSDIGGQTATTNCCYIGFLSSCGVHHPHDGQVNVHSEQECDHEPQEEEQAQDIARCESIWNETLFIYIYLIYLLYFWRDNVY